MEAQLRIQGLGDIGSDFEKKNDGALELHKYRFNYLFSDDHIEGLNPYDTIGTGTLINPKGIWSTGAND